MIKTIVSMLLSLSFAFAPTAFADNTSNADFVQFYSIETSFMKENLSESAEVIEAQLQAVKKYQFVNLNKSLGKDITVSISNASRFIFDVLSSPDIQVVEKQKLEWVVHISSSVGEILNDIAEPYEDPLRRPHIRKHDKVWAYGRWVGWFVRESLRDLHKGINPFRPNSKKSKFVIPPGLPFIGKDTKRTKLLHKQVKSIHRAIFNNSNEVVGAEDIAAQKRLIAFNALFDKLKDFEPLKFKKLHRIASMAYIGLGILLFISPLEVFGRPMADPIVLSMAYASSMLFLLNVRYKVSGYSVGKKLMKIKMRLEKNSGKKTKTCRSSMQ